MAVPVMAGEPSAAELFAQGRKAEKAGHMAQAYVLYSEAAAMEPDNLDYYLRTNAVRSRAALESKPVPPPLAGLDLKDESGLPRLEPPTAEDLAEARKPLPPTELKAQSGTKDFDLRANAQALFENVAHAFGLDCVFDTDYQAGPTIRFTVQGMDHRAALHALETVTGSFIVPLTSKVFLVAKDTAQKRNDLEPRVAVAIQVPSPSSAQEYTAVLTGVQQVMALDKVSLDINAGTIVIRDRLSKVLPARAMIEELMRPKAQVVIEMRFLEVSWNDMITYGIDFPTLVSLTPLTNVWNNAPSIAQNIVGLLAFGGGKSLMGIGIMNPSLVARMSESNAKLLLNSQLRSLDGQAATLHVGDRYPIMQSGYFGPASFSGPGAYTPPPSFTYEDLGLTLKVTPAVHSAQDVTLDIDAQFKLLTGSAVNGIPIISNRSMQGKANLKFDEWAVVAGLLDTNEARTVAGLAGLSRIPGLRALTSTHERDRSRDQMLILMCPRLVTEPPADTPTRSYWVGTETRPLDPL
jgi:type II secretory pathway component GspD/PulD (secretin)